MTTKSNFNRYLGTENNDSYSSPKIDLQNFEDPVYEGSKYVLTSPRSLEACSCFDLKPLDLLYKPLADFQEELLPQDIPLRTIYNIYDDHEQNRMRKLRLCREERYCLMKIENKKTPSNNKKGSFVKCNAGKDVDIGTMQRQRTAWTTSVGHKRITADDIEERANEIHHESLKLKQELLSRKEGRSRKVKPTRKSTSKPSVNISTGSRNRSTIRTTRSKLVTVSKPDVVIPDTDKKIVELMTKKREAEIEFYSRRRKARLAWAESQQQDEQIKEDAALKRRNLIAEENRIQVNKKHERERRIKEDIERKQAEISSSMLESSRTWETNYMRQEKIRDLQLTEKKEKEKLKKHIQLSNLKSSDFDREDIERQVERRIEANKSNVEHRRDTHTHAERLKVLIENQKQHDAFEKRRQDMLSQKRYEKELLSCTQEQKHLDAQSNIEKMLNQKYQHIQLSQSKREHRQSHARESVEKLEGEMEDWRSALTQRRRQMERKASHSVEKKLNDTVQRVHEERVARKKEHSANVKKIHKELNIWEKSVRKEIKLKDMKSKLLNEEKEASIAQTRLVADASKKLRDEVRCKYDNETLADKALHAQMYTRMGTGVSSATKNSCSFRFG